MLDGLSTLLEYFQRERHKRTDKEQEALEKLHEAVHETTKYVNSGTMDEDREMDLSNLWGVAAIAARNISKDLANRCYIKGGYWRDPDSWSYEKIAASRISLDEIDAALGDLISQ